MDIGSVAEVIYRRGFTDALYTHTKTKSAREGEQRVFLFFNYSISTKSLHIRHLWHEHIIRLLCQVFLCVRGSDRERELPKYLIWDIVNASPN